MVLSFLIIIDFALCILLLALLVAVAFTSYFYYCIGIFALLLFTYLLGSTFFHISSKRALIGKEDNYYNFPKYYEREIEEITVCKKKNIWEMHIGGNTINFVFGHYLFQKSFIRAYVVRNLMYKHVDRKRELRNLMNYRFQSPNSNNVDIVFISEDKRKRIRVCNCGQIQNTILSRAITKSHFYKLYFSNVTYYAFMNQIVHINEKIYDSFVD